MIETHPISKQSSARASIIANAVGRIWVLSANIVMFPVYIAFLGTEQFGIIGMLIAVTAIVAVFDFGLTPVLARQFNNQALPSEDRVDLLHSAERFYLMIVVCVAGTALILPSTWLGWLAGASPKEPEVATLLRLIFGVAIAQLLLNFYINALSGVEMQVTSNAINVGTGMLRSVAVILPLWFLPYAETFLWWQLMSSLVGILIARGVIYRHMLRFDANYNTRFRLALLRVNIPAVRGSFMLALAATITMNLDRLVVGRMGGLDKISEYTIVAVFSQLIFIATVPLTMAVIPRLTRAITSNNKNYYRDLLTATRTSVGIITAIIFFVFVRHGADLIELWSGGNIQKEKISSYAIWLFVGSAALSLSSISHCVAASHQDYSFGRIYLLGVPFITLMYYLVFTYSQVNYVAFVWGCSQIIVAFFYRGWVVRRLMDGKMNHATPWLGVLIGGFSGSFAGWIIGIFSAEELSFVGTFAVVGSELALSLLLSFIMLLLLGRRIHPDDGLVGRVTLSTNVKLSKILKVFSSI